MLRKRGAAKFVICKDASCLVRLIHHSLGCCRPRFRLPAPSRCPVFLLCTAASPSLKLGNSPPRASAGQPSGRTEQSAQLWPGAQKGPCNFQWPGMGAPPRTDCPVGLTHRFSSGPQTIPKIPSSMYSRPSPLSLSLFLFLRSPKGILKADGAATSRGCLDSGCLSRPRGLAAEKEILESPSQMLALPRCRSEGELSAPFSPWVLNMLPVFP